MNEPLSVYVVEDDLAVMQAVLAALSRPANNFFLAGAATDRDTAVHAAEEGLIDILIADKRLPEADGLDLIARAKAARPSLRTVLMTGHPSPDLALAAFLAGADAVLYKPFNADELCDCLRAVLTGQRVLCDAAASQLAYLLRTVSPPPADPEADGRLTKREAEVLCLLGTGLTAKEVGDHLELSPETITTYRKQAFKKLSVHKLPAAIHKLREPFSPPLKLPVESWVHSPPP